MAECVSGQRRPPPSQRRYEGVFHFRGYDQTGTVTGDLSGTIVLTVNLDLCRR